MPVPKIGRRSNIDLTAIETTTTLSDEQRVTEAGELLATYLPADAQEMVKEAATNMGVPTWQIILGHVMKSAERFEIFSPVLMSSWETGGRPNLPRPCKTCGQEFISRFPDAAFCCETCAFDKLEQLGHKADCPIQLAEAVK